MPVIITVLLFPLSTNAKIRERKAKVQPEEKVNENAWKTNSGLIDALQIVRKDLLKNKKSIIMEKERANND